MNKKVLFTTWTPAELAIGEYLITWALKRLTRGGIRNRAHERQVAAFQKRLRAIRDEQNARKQAFVDAWLNDRPLPKAEHGFRIHTLTKILHRIIQRNPF